MRGANISMSLANFDMTLGAMTLNSRDWIRDIICAALISVLIIWPRLLKKRISPRVLTALACLCVFVGAFSQISISSRSMPTRPKFNYPETETMSLLKVMEGRRAIATGVHTMRPNTNLAYGFKDARFHNPIFPARYLAFMEKAGAKLDEFNQVFDDDPSGMIDLASISLIVTPGALVERKFFDSHVSDGVSNIMPPLPLKWTPTLTLSKLRYAVDPVEGAVFIEPTWQNSSTKSSKYAFNICIVNAAGEETWISDRLQIVESPSQVFTIGAPIRKALQNGKQLGIKISVFETASGALLEPLFQATGSKTGQALIKFQVPSPANIAKPDKTNASPVISSATTSGATAETSNAPISTSSGTVVSTPVSSSSPSTTFERRFKLLQESSDGIRIYENLSALPEAYVATSSIYIADKNAVLEKISSPDFDARNVVVLQGAGKDVLLPKGSFREPEARIMQRDSTEILVRTTSSKPAFLVLTDTWYPGWSAIVDGAPVSVLRANYSFRAVAIPAGMHNVQFRYIPVLFYVGLALFALAGQVVIAMSIVQWSIWRRARRS